MHDPSAAALGRRQRLERLERLLDVWIDRFEEALEDARPDPSKTTELSNVFTVCKRIAEIEQLELRLARAAQEERDGEEGGLLVDSALFGEGVSPED